MFCVADEFSGQSSPPPVEPHQTSSTQQTQQIPTALGLSGRTFISDLESYNYDAGGKQEWLLN